MKEICQCQCSLTGYKNPWCDLLKSLNGTTGEVLHLWYKLDWLRKEVSKRSAYLGKFRRTEEAAHLLDLIKMTQDEDNLFVPFAKAAMADVADALVFYTPKQELAFFWNEGKTTVVFDDPEDTPEGTVDAEGYMYMPSIANMDVEGFVPLDITIDAEGYASFNNAPKIVTFVKGDYVLYNGHLYRAIADGDSRDVIGKLEPTEDYRESIRFGLTWNCGKSNINMVEPLDTAIFEALVARIIYKWLQYAYPDEAPRYLAEWNECMAKISTRVRFLNGPAIVNRIPRAF